jgi:8-oxo-dGTP pyrophosphatase MutT (NUDIX family)
MGQKCIPAVKALIVKENKFLVIQDADDFFWELPGGKIKHNEKPYDALKREIKEELGIEIEINEFVGFCWSTTKEHHVVMSVFKCKAKSYKFDNSKNPSTEKIKELKFVSKKEFLTVKYKTFNPSLKALIKTLEI